MTKIKLGGLLLALCTALTGCTIYLDIEESDKGDDTGDWNDDSDWSDGCGSGGACPDAGYYPPDDGGGNDCWDPWGNWICPNPTDAGFPPDDGGGYDCWDQWGNWICPQPEDGGGGGIFPDASPAPYDDGGYPNPGDDAGPGC